MRVAINTRFLLSGSLEGMGRFTLEVSKRLVEQHPDWEFLFLFDRPYDPVFLFGPNVRPVVVPPPARHPLLFYLWYEWAVPAVLQKRQADVFLSTDNFGSLRTSCPTVIVCHDLAFKHFPEQVDRLTGWFYNYYVPRYYQKAEHIIAVSDFTRQDIIRQYGISPDKVSVACNAAGPAFRPLGPEEVEKVRREYSDGQPYFFYVGSIHPRKNVARLIRAFDQFKARSGSTVKLLLAGRMAWKTGEVKQAWERARCKKDIVFLGYVPEEKLPALLGGALGLTYVSLFEGFGVPLLEAMQAGVPVITSDRSSMPEVAGEAALLVDPEREEEIARAMQQIQKDDRLRNSLIEKGMVQREKYSWERAADVVEAAILTCNTDFRIK